VQEKSLKKRLLTSDLTFTVISRKRPSVKVILPRAVGAARRRSPVLTTEGAGRYQSGEGDAINPIS
jgi:hypothetical protein